MTSIETVTGRAIKLYMMFQAGERLTCKDVENALGIRRQSAQNYIDTMCSFLPIYETDDKRQNDNGPPSIVYRIMK